MAYRILVLTIAAGVSLSSATLAKERCPVGEIYFRSKHTCVAKGTAFALRIYHYRRHIAAKADETAIVHRPLRARPASAAAIPLPPVRLVGTGMASTPARNDTVDGSRSIVPPTPEIVRRSASPYGTLVPVTPAE